MKQKMYPTMERFLERFKQVNTAGEDGYHAGQGSSPSTGWHHTCEVSNPWLTLYLHLHLTDINDNITEPGSRVKSPCFDFRSYIHDTQWMTMKHVWQTVMCDIWTLSYSELVAVAGLEIPSMQCTSLWFIILFCVHKTRVDVELICDNFFCF